MKETRKRKQQGAAMKKKYSYKIITSTSGFKELEDNVNEALNNGWKPIGGIAFNSGYSYQAVAKIIEDQEKSSQIT